MHHYKLNLVVGAAKRHVFSAVYVFSVKSVPKQTCLCVFQASKCCFLFMRFFKDH